MSSNQQLSEQESDARAEAWRVIDDLDDEVPISCAELEAVEAFLMRVVEAILADSSVDGPADSDEKLGLGSHR